MSELQRLAHAVRDNAYAPYSGFRVGCAVRSESGRVFIGTNVENASYPEGICAERSAVAALIAAGERRVVEVAVVGSAETPCVPCGGCRQFLFELATPDTEVHMYGAGGAVLTRKMAELLPEAFTLEPGDDA